MGDYPQMLRLTLTCFYLTLSILGKPQCLTSYEKLFPGYHPGITTPHILESSNQFLVVGLPHSDTLSLNNSGKVNVYHYSTDDLLLQQVIHPPFIMEDSKFGWDARISNNFLMISAPGSNNEASSENTLGRVYLYQKIGTQFELAVIFSDSTSDNGQYGHSIAISPDEKTIAIAEPYHGDSIVHIYHDPSGLWTGSFSHLILNTSISTFDYNHQVELTNDHLAIGAKDIQVYKNQSGDWNSAVEVARYQGNTNYEYIGHDFNFRDNLLVCNPEPDDPYIPGLLTFQKEESQEWNNTISPIFLTVSDTVRYRENSFSILNDSTIFFSYNPYYQNIEPTNEFKVYQFNRSKNMWNHSNETTTWSFTSDFYGEIHNIVINDNHFSMITNENIHNNTYMNRKSVIDLTYSIETGINAESQKRYNQYSYGTNYFRYGQSVVTYEDLLFVGVEDYTGLVPRSGAVYLYQRQPDSSYKFLQIIESPTPERQGQFGHHMDIRNDTLAIVARKEYSRIFDGNESIANESAGKLHVYHIKKEDGTHTIEHLYEYKRYANQYFNLAVDEVIERVQIGDGFIALSIVQENKFPGYGFVSIHDSKNGDYITKLENDDAVLFGADISVNENLVLVGAIQSKYVDLYKKPASGWENKLDPIARFSVNTLPLGTFGTRWGEDVELTDHALFISAGFVNEPNNEGVYIFQRPTDGHWVNNDTSFQFIKNSYLFNNGAIFGLRNRFNTIMHVFDNTLLLGEWKVNADETAVESGQVHIFQTTSYNWSNHKFLITLEGDGEEDDFFGNSFSSTNSQIIVGAHQDQSPTGDQSGTVYAIDLPPVIKTIAPACIDGGVRQLSAYPAGGEWTGPGIIDEEQGLFDPKTTGLGTFSLTYSSPNCSSDGEVLITVLEALDPSIITPQPTLCEGETIILEAVSQPNVNWQWYKLQESSLQPLLPGRTTPIDKPGQYVCQITNLYCDTYSDTVSIEQLEVEILIDSIEAICDNELVSFNAFPEGGTWLGDGVDHSGIFNPQEVENGINSIYYSFIDQSGCIHHDTTTFYVNEPLNPPLFQDVSSPLCSSSQLIQTTKIIGASYTFYEIIEEEEAISLTAGPENTQMIDHPGTYQSLTSLNGCHYLSDQLEIDLFTDSIDFIIRNELDSIVENFCEGEILTLSTSEIPGLTYSYYTMNENGTINHFQDGSSIEITEGGAFQLVGESNFCEFNSQWKDVEIFRSTFLETMPNVFTPNNDGYNDQFEFNLNGTIRNYHFQVVNRSGNKVFESLSPDQFWKGDNTPQGVYYWSLTYWDPCEEQGHEHQGYVRLLK